MKAFFRRPAPVRDSRTGWPAAWTSMAAGNRALLPSTPTVSPAVAASKAAATVREAISNRVQGKRGIVPPAARGFRAVRYPRGDAIVQSQCRPQGDGNEERPARSVSSGRSARAPYRTAGGTGPLVLGTGLELP